MNPALELDVDANHLETLAKLGLLTFVLRLGLRDSLVDLCAAKGRDGDWLPDLEARIIACVKNFHSEPPLPIEIEADAMNQAIAVIRETFKEARAAA